MRQGDVLPEDNTSMMISLQRPPHYCGDVVYVNPVHILIFNRASG